MSRTNTAWSTVWLQDAIMFVCERLQNMSALVDVLTHCAEVVCGTQCKIVCENHLYANE